MGPEDQVDFMSDSFPVDQRYKCVKKGRGGNTNRVSQLTSYLLFLILCAPELVKQVVKGVLTAVTVTEVPPQTGPCVIL